MSKPVHAATDPARLDLWLTAQVLEVIYPLARAAEQHLPETDAGRIALVTLSDSLETLVGACSEAVTE